MSKLKCDRYTQKSTSAREPTCLEDKQQQRALQPGQWPLCANARIHLHAKMIMAMLKARQGGWAKWGTKLTKVGMACRHAGNRDAHHDLPQRHTCMLRHAEAQASRLCFSCHARSLLEAEQRLSSGREMVRFESHRRGMEIEERTAPPIQRTQLTFLVEQQRGAAFSRPSKVGRRSCRGEAIRQ